MKVILFCLYHTRRTAMIHRATAIPITIVDGFLESPQVLLDIAQETSFVEDTNYPGARSDCLSNIDYYLYDQIVSGILRLYTSAPVLDYRATATLQKVSSKYGGGWVHRDPGLFTAITYLNSTDSPDGGTSLYKIKETLKGNEYHKKFEEMEVLKRGILASKRRVDSGEYKKYGVLNNEMYDEVLKVPGAFNRLVCFDGHLLHAAGSYDREGPEERLTLVIFFHAVVLEGGSLLPLDRLRRLSA